MERRALDVSVKAKVPLTQRTTFRAFADELALALHQVGIEFEPKSNSVVRQNGKEIGRVVTWEQWKHIAIILHYSEWEQADTKIGFRFQTVQGGTRVFVESSGLVTPFLRGAGEPLGWFASQVVAPLLGALSPSRFGDWLTDRTARRPTGDVARKGYRNPTHHRPNFGAILEELALTPKDKLLEIGCGGGALLHDALQCGCTAAGIDHSLEMVRVARRANAAAIKAGRLEVRESSADSLPFSDSSFTCVTMTSVIGFLEDPVKVFTEAHRTLTPDGKMVVFSTSIEAKGTIAAPEPMASRIHFYEDAELERMALKAGFKDARVKRPDLSKFLKGVAIPKRDVQSFSVPIGQLLVARK